MERLLPYLEFWVNTLADHYRATLFMGTGAQGGVINISATVTADIYQYNFPIAPKGAQFTAAVTVAHALIPWVVIYSILLLWPGSFRQLILRLWLGVIAAILVISLTEPALLAAHIEEIFYAALQKIANQEMPMPRLLYWVMFMEVGGIWWLSINMAIVCIWISARLDAFIWRGAGKPRRSA